MRSYFYAATFVAALLLIGCNAVYGQEKGMVVDAKVVSLAKPQLPKEAKESGLGGKVSVLVSIDESGKVISAEDATGPDWVCPSVTRPDVVALRNAAKAAALKAKFSPATTEGRPVASTMRLDFEFPKAKLWPEKPSTGTYMVIDEAPRSKGAVDNSTTITGNKNSAASEVKPMPVGSERPVYTVRGDSVAVPGDYKGEVLKAGPVGPGKTISGGVLNGKAIALPKPAYPRAAIAVHAAGAVSVQVLISEDGTVFSAEPKGGHPLLQPASRIAACGARFTPIPLMGQPIKVSGIITYNFVP